MVNAISPPKANSHRRVVVTKYARPGLASVRYIDHARELTALTRSVMKVSLVTGPCVFFAVHASATSRSGQRK
jgi:hypothetical protein